MKIKKSKLESAPRFKNLYFLFPKPASLQTFNMHTCTADSSFKEFFLFLKKAHSDVNHRKMGRDQKKNDILFVFLYFRETASLTSSLNGTPKQLPITAGSFTCPNSCYTGVEWEHHAISVFSYREWHCSFYRIISLYY